MKLKRPLPRIPARAIKETINSLPRGLRNEAAPMGMQKKRARGQKKSRIRKFSGFKRKIHKKYDMSLEIPDAKCMVFFDTFDDSYWWQNKFAS